MNKANHKPHFSVLTSVLLHEIRLKGAIKRKKIQRETKRSLDCEILKVTNYVMFLCPAPHIGISPSTVDTPWTNE
jgi:hypothetical protein